MDASGRRDYNAHGPRPPPDYLQFAVDCNTRTESASVFGKLLMEDELLEALYLKKIKNNNSKLKTISFFKSLLFSLVECILKLSRISMRNIFCSRIKKCKITDLSIVNIAHFQNSKFYGFCHFCLDRKSVV